MGAGSRGAARRVDGEGGGPQGQAAAVLRVLGAPLVARALAACEGEAGGGGGGGGGDGRGGWRDPAAAAERASMR